MPSLFNLFLRGCILLTAFIGVLQSMNAQCNPPGQLPSQFCETAPLTCLQDACYSMTESPGFGPIGWCGPNTSIQNPQYFKFIASDDFVEIHIHVDGCESGSGIQAGIFWACPWVIGDVLACQPEVPPGGTIVLITTEVMPGEMYWLVVDGYSGSICDYTINYVAGVEQVDIPGELNEAETYAEPGVVCQGYDSIRLVTGPLLPEAHGYYWTFSWWPDTVTSTLNELYFDFVPDPPAGENSFCVRAFSGCDTTNEVCHTFIVLPPDTIEKLSVLCPEVFPFTWGSTTISGPGIYQETFEDANGCLTDTIWLIEAYPEQPVDTITHAFCDLPDNYVPGTYTLFYPGVNIYGCDSTAVLIIIDGEISSIVDVNCESDEFSLHALVEELGYPNDELTYTWYTCDYSTLLYTGHVYTPDSAGCYCLIITGLFCQDTACITITEETCFDECGLVEDYYCAGEEIVFTLPWHVSQEAEIRWQIYHHDDIIQTIDDDTLFSFVFDDPGDFEIVVMVIDSGISMFCREAFVVDEIPYASICCNQVICDSCAHITIEATTVVNLGLVDDLGFLHEFKDVLNGSAIELCPPVFPFTIFLLEVSGALSGCAGTPFFPDQVTLSRSPDIVIQQTGEILCIESENPHTVKWHACGDTTALASGLCYEPETNGCYCVEITDAHQCLRSDCYDFMVNTLDVSAEGFTFFPNPSAESFSILIPDHVSLPVDWTLYDGAGKPVGTGSMEDRKSQFAWPEQVVPGKYEMLMRDGEKVYRLGLMRMGN